MDARDIRIRQSRLLETIHALRMRLFRTERAYVKAIARECVLERRIVNLRIVGQRDERRVAVDAERRKRRVRPFRDDLHIRKTFNRGKGRARIDNGDVVAEQLTDRRQRLADMHRAGDDEARRRHIDGQENAPFRRVLHAAFAHAQPLVQHVLQRIF
jgi:hypothetical protein